jgi:hypothetical protein
MLQTMLAVSNNIPKVFLTMIPGKQAGDTIRKTTPPPLFAFNSDVILGAGASIEYLWRSSLPQPFARPPMSVTGIIILEKIYVSLLIDTFLDKELYGEGYAYIALGDWFGKWLIILY